MLGARIPGIAVSWKEIAPDLGKTAPTQYRGCTARVRKFCIYSRASQGIVSRRTVKPRRTCLSCALTSMADCRMCHFAVTNWIHRIDGSRSGREISYHYPAPAKDHGALFHGTTDASWHRRGRHRSATSRDPDRDRGATDVRARTPHWTPHSGGGRRLTLVRERSALGHPAGRAHRRDGGCRNGVTLPGRRRRLRLGTGGHGRHFGFGENAEKVVADAISNAADPGSAVGMLSVDLQCRPYRSGRA